MKFKKFWFIFFPIILVLALVGAGLLVLCIRSGVFTPAPTASLNATAPEDARELVFVADYDFSPYSFLNEDGTPNGLDAELSYELANRLGMRPKINFATWGECKEALKNKEADVLLGLEIFVDGAATGTLKSIPIGSDKLSIIGKDAIDDAAALSEKRVGVSFGSALMGLFKLNCEYVEYFTYSEMLAALDAGEVDYAICHASVAEVIIDRNGYAVSPSLVLMESFPTMGIREDEPELLEDINRTLEEMSADGTIEHLREKWIDYDYGKVTLSDLFARGGDFLGVYAVLAITVLAGYYITAIVLRSSLERKEVLDALASGEKSRKLVDSVVSRYDVAFTVNMKDDSYHLIKSKGLLGDKNKSFKTYSDSNEEFFKIIHPGDREMMRREMDYATIREKLEKTPSYTVEYRVIYDNATLWHLMTVSKVDDDNIALGFADRDVELTKNHLQNRRYKEYFGLYEADLDTGMFKVIIDSPYYTFSKTGAPVPYSEAMMKFAESQEGETKEFFKNLSDPEWVKNTLSSNTKNSFVYHSVTADGRWVDVTSYLTKRHEDRTPAMFVLGFSFVSEAGAERAEMKEKLAEALDMAQTANKAKTDFLFNMSHDIRTPMNAIIGFTGMAMKHIDDRERVIDSLTKTQEASELLLSLINDILDMSRIESGKIKLDENEGDVYLSFATIETTMRELAQAKDISLNFSFDRITDRYVYADFSRCMRVFVNIITNAIKYTENGGHVNVRCEQLSSENGTGTYRYTFEDDGIGMSEEFQKRVFDEFTREETATVSGIQGTGLGLAVCRSFVTAMNGTIECESTQGIGSVFTVTLPFRIQENHNYMDPLSGKTVSADKGAQVAAPTGSFAGKRVLLVEDNEMNREIAEEILSEEGMAVETANDGSAAVRIMRERGEDYYDFILMDIQMPIMNGYEATKAIREMYPKSGIPIIALSANAFEEDKIASLTAGMNDHVAKPIDISVLFAVLSKYM